jgi:hypothetical protein
MQTQLAARARTSQAAGRNRTKLMASEYRVLADEIRRREAEAR